MMQWRVRLMIVLGAFVLAAPALARPEGAPGKRPALPTQTAAVLDSTAESHMDDGGGGDVDDGLVDKDLGDGHFGW